MSVHLITVECVMVWWWRWWRWERSCS